MAQKNQKQQKRKRAIRPDKSAAKSHESPFNIYLDKQNYILIAVGFVVLIIGFYLLSVGEWDSVESLTIAPLVLLAAYLIIFPLAIIKNFKKKKELASAEKEGK